ncbi:molybdopterin biosynthesis protein MoeB [Desulfuromonas versatilis]|uniref:Molybdopterin biosynthesis protein MoeB n=1 Tax=Desulfuromonas versatilis TaxID=2802975 RepID=A0ABM8HR88_9BACT|nr:HesA/MoeB/ThiF family protein [Desulfuromonas versatilis]BCR04453.1 molybdopterin biosynthesis protein MoeB [Desulfuromonas versatilis]
MKELLSFLQTRCQGDLLPWQAQAEAARVFGVSPARIEAIALENSLLPARYQRNRTIISCQDQLRLFSSRVAVIGCGGLGGYVLEELARLGVGELVAVDPDVFEEHNLNRQLLSSPASLGMKKTAAALERVSLINPAVTLVSAGVAFGRENGSELLRDCTLAVDCLDSIEARMELGMVCNDLGIPLVHGAIAGWFGHVATQFPGEKTLECIYCRHSGGKGVEKQLGNPSFTPAVVASLEVAEVCKVLLGKGSALRGRILSVDLLEMDFVETTL